MNPIFIPFAMLAFTALNILWLFIFIEGNYRIKKILPIIGPILFSTFWIGVLMSAITFVQNWRA